MRQQLIQYVDLLFAGAPDSEDIKQEILQNTLDRYDDLVSQGKSPEAAYRLAIAGIGDVNEILGGTSAHHSSTVEPQFAVPMDDEKETKRKKTRAVGIVMYIVCALPLIILSDIGYELLGLVLTILLVACATYLMLITGKDDRDEEHSEEKEPLSPLRKNIKNVITVIALLIFLTVSFSSGAWFITWLIFPLAGCVKGIIFAIMDLKEENHYEA